MISFDSIKVGDLVLAGSSIEGVDGKRKPDLSESPIREDPLIGYITEFAIWQGLPCIYIYFPGISESEWTYIESDIQRAFKSGWILIKSPLTESAK